MNPICAAQCGDRAVDVLLLALKRWTQVSPNYHQRLQRSDCQSRKVGGRVTPCMRITTYRALQTYVTITRLARAACALRSDAPPQTKVVSIAGLCPSRHTHSLALIHDRATMLDELSRVVHELGEEASAGFSFVGTKSTTSSKLSTMSRT
jgi:hypothetical protein